VKYAADKTAESAEAGAKATGEKSEEVGETIKSRAEPWGDAGEVSLSLPHPLTHARYLAPPHGLAARRN
jgi:hypothetical protein